MAESGADLKLSSPYPTASYGDPEGTDGDLLSLEPEKAAALAMRLWQNQKEIMRPVLEQVVVNECMRRGVVGAKLIKDPETGAWRARTPLKSVVSAEFINKAATLCRKFTGVITADPPAAECTPGEGSGDDPNSAEFGTRALQNVEHDMGRTKKFTRAIDLSHTCATAFEHFYYDTTAGGRAPVEIEAGFDPITGVGATHVSDAEFRSVPNEEGGTDIRPWPKLKMTYVKEDGTLTDNKAEAAAQWIGRAQEEVVRLGNVRLYPHTAEDIDDAHGAGILTFQTWGKIKKRFPEEIDKIPKEKLDAIFMWKPDWSEYALPMGVDGNYLERVRSETGEDRDEWLVPILTTYFDGKRCPNDYPKGVYMIQLADSVVLHRGHWELKDDSGVTQPRMIPLSQMTLFREGRAFWPGVALMELIGPGNEVRAAQVGTMLEYLDRLSSVKTLVPTDSILDPFELKDRNQRYVRYNPLGGVPAVEKIPPYPGAAVEMFNMMTQEMRDDSGLQESGSGLEAASVKSGVQAMAVISQIQATLSPQARAAIDCYLRGSKIILEIVRAHYTKSRQISWVGEDGRYKQQAWSRSDIGSTTDVKLQAGTMTMLRPAQKALLAREFFELGVLPPDDFQQTAEKNIGGTLAMQDNPFRQRIRRQIEDWLKGPPEGWQPGPIVMEPVMAPAMAPDGLPSIGVDGQPAMQPRANPDGSPAMQPKINPLTGKPMRQIDPIVKELWEPVPSDTTPIAAQTRLVEISRLTARVAYLKHPAEWREAVESEFAKMQAVVMQSAMQQQMAGQQQAAQKKNPNRPVRNGASGVRRTLAPNKDGSNQQETDPQKPGVMPMATAMG